MRCTGACSGGKAGAPAVVQKARYSKMQGLSAGFGKDGGIPDGKRQAFCKRLRESELICSLRIISFQEPANIDIMKYLL